MSDFQAESTPTARKHHQCCECEGSIEPGQKYQLIAGSWEGRMHSFKTCMSCLEARDWATSQIEWCGGDDHLYYFGQLEEDLSIMAPEIVTQDGRRFHAYRLGAQIANRRMLARAKLKAA
ncbi:hypothetical protein [Pseudomonas anguilliseptica]|uniref:Uncharacterized protein n=1 Tax=Pseudomonas anguilliseptica TaxID=53406 RepID=A0A1H5F0N2_PSEAG|nr:hypothetical protein [Pseudomonas anguilliseptica]SED96929.1 hypothetical protein SAMN05421553_3750 [Pseudomonas anguilliseptica]